MDGAGPLLVGVDLLDLSRAPDQRSLARRILAADEETAAVVREHGVHPCLALKEAIVKAVGGRPPGFRWQGATIVGEVTPVARPASLVQIVASAAGRGARAVYLDCGLDRPLASWARLRLSVPADVQVRCAGAWTMSDADELFAAVVIEPAGHR